MRFQFTYLVFGLFGGVISHQLMSHQAPLWSLLILTRVTLEGNTSLQNVLVTQFRSIMGRLFRP